MKYPFYFLVLFIIFRSNISAQEINTDLLQKDKLNIGLDKSEKQSLANSLSDFFKQIENKNIVEAWISAEHRELSISSLSSLASIKYEGKNDSIGLYKCKLVDCYPLNKDQFMAKISFVKNVENAEPVIKLIYSFVLTKSDAGYLYSIPLDYYTRYWKRKVVGGVTYYYRNEINVDRAEAFNLKNNEIAGKFDLEPVELKFYMTENYQEVNRLMGFDFEADNAGRSRDGYGVDSKTIFAIQNNEDFSHDIFHYYSGKVNKRINRNWVTEEGVAYLWGNAYYTDSNGEMINQELCVEELRKYIKDNPKADLLKLFKDHAKIFPQLAPEVKVRSVISGVFCKEVERRYGMEGIQQMINAGAKERMKKYFVVIEELLSVTENNFNQEVRRLIAE